MSTPQVTPTLAQAVRAKFPGQYDDLDDVTLENKILAKYPQYGNMPRTAPNAGLAPPASPQNVIQDQSGLGATLGSLLAPGPLYQKARQSYKANPNFQDMPGSFEGHPENIGEYVPRTVGRATEGATDISRGNVAMGSRKLLQAGGNAIAPMAPMAIAAYPLSAATGIGTGYVTGKATKGVAKLAGASPDQAGLAEDLGNLAGGYAGVKSLPFLKNYLPSVRAQQAGQLFNQAASAANDVPIDMTAPGNTALRIQEAAGRGGSMPKVVRDFIRRATDPDQGPITYEEARDFYQNASRLSADEANRLTPNQKRMIGQFANDLGNSIQGAANQAGVGAQYINAMAQYRKAMQMRDFLDMFKGGAVSAVKYGVPTAVGGTAAGYIMKKALGAK